MDEDPGRQPIPTSERQHLALPQGYRQGIITAITVLLGFSLAFFRFWGFEASGEWAPRSIIPAGTLVVAILLQIVALVRSLRLEDDDPNKYRKTVMWFTTSAVVIHHVSPPRYVLRVTLATCEGGTAIEWAQEFEDGAVADRIRHIVEPANEQNLNRLQAVLAGGES
jgi:hypothetical protein